MSAQSDYQHGTPSQTGVMLINLGTPEAPTAKALRPYLKEFLSNPRVIEIPRLIWLPILYGFILPFRSGQSAEKYAQIWMPEGSPLKVHTELQTQLLAQTLRTELTPAPMVEYAMNIGNPSVDSVLTKMKNAGCERILVIPLFPQYAASSTAAAMDAVFSALRNLRNMPAIRTVKQYHDHPGYISALAQSICDYWDQHGKPDKLVISFHGIPRKNLEKGDPYHCFCQKTGRLLAETLNLDLDHYQVCFQSRFGRAEWLQPYTAATLEQLGKAHTRRVDIVCPGFVSDCLETLEEIAIEGKKIFIEAGGTEYHYIPCLNERSDWIAVLADIARTHLQGWGSPEPEENTLEQSKKRAIAMGAPQ